MRSGPSVMARFFVEQRLLVWLLFASLAFHAAVGFVFRVGTFARAVRGPSQPFVQYIGMADEAALGLAAVRDPSLTSMASSHGFSASALTPPPHFPYQPPSVDQPSRPLTSPLLVAEPARPPAAAALLVETPAARLAPSSQEPVEMAVASVVTRVVFSPSLASRAPKPALGALRAGGPAPQQATVLRVAVDGAGIVRYALLAESSGSTAADNSGVRQVQTWRFVAADRPAEALDWGEVRIIWAVAGETSSPSAPAPGAGGGTR